MASVTAAAAAVALGERHQAARAQSECEHEKFVDKNDKRAARASFCTQSSRRR